MSRNAKRILSHIICLAMLLAAALPALPALPAHAEAQAAGGAAATAAVAAAAVATGGALGAKTAAEAAQTVGPAQTLQPTHAVQATQTSELSQTAQTPVADANAAAEPVAAPSAEPTAKPAQAPVDGANAPTAPAAKPPQALGTETAPSAEADGEAAEATPEPQPEAGASSEAVPPPEAAPAPEAAPEPDPEPALEPAAEPGLIPLGWSDEAPVLAVQASRGVQISIAHPALNADGLAAGVQVFYTNDGAEPDDSGSATRKKVEPSARSGAGPSWSISAAQGGPPLPYGVYKAAVVLDGKASAVGQCSYNPAPPVAAYGSGAYKLLAEVALEAPSGVSGGKIYYETGTAGIENRAPKPGEVAGIAEPSDQSAQYAGPIAVAGAGIDTAFVVKAKLFLDSFQSDTITLWYTIDASLPTLSDVKASDSQADIDAKIAKVLDAMSIDELVNMTGGVGMSPASALNSGVAGSTYAIPRLGVPSTLLSDGPAGVRMGKSATVWMSPTGLASTWDTGAIGQVAGRVAEEAKYYAVDVMLAPALNIQRNPLGGRDFEYYSEDPVISGETAAAYTRALQAGGVGVTLKHFAANNQETARSNGETVVSERALREIYLAGFERAAREGPWTVMSSYNKINSVSAASNKWLLTDMLRDAFGFTGYVMTDWGGGRNGPDSMEAQNDMWQTSGAQAAIKLWLDDAGAGQAERDRRLALVKRNVANILRVIVKTPVFNGVYGGLAQADIAARGAGFYSDAQSPYADSRALNRRTSAEGMVLLKNDGLAGLGGEKALPLPAGSSVALVASSVARTAFGTTGGGFGASGSVAVKDLVIEGGGSAQVAWDQTKGVSLEAGLAGAGFSVPYACVDADIAAMGAAQRAAQADAAAAAADAGIMVISRTSSEGKDNAQSSFDLSDAEKAALELFGGAFGAAGKRFVVLINAGASINVQQINEYADAALVVYLPGTEGGAAIADILSGAVSPSGKLTQTFPLEYDDSPSIAMAAKGREGQTWATNPVFLDEGVYVGYRYFDTFGKEDRVAYPFGHGLSYTTFSYTDLALSKSHFSATDESDAIGVSVKVTNTGKVAGRAVAELYLGASTYAEEGRPAKELKRYAKTGLLAPGASETATFTIAKRDLQYFDDGAADPLAVVGAAPNAVSNVTYDGPGWTVAPGTRFTVTVGGTSDGAVLEAQGAKAAFDYGQVDSRGFELIAQVEEYGAVVSAAVIDLGAGASASAADVGAAKFEVKTRGLNSAGQPNARLTERNIARAYPSAAPAIDPAHRGAASGRYIVLELEYGYGNANESSLIQYVTETDSSSGRPIGRNVQKPVASDYAIRQTAAVGGIPASTQYACSGVRTLVADDFARLATAADGLAYRLFSPQRQAGAKYPLVVWLHGAGEGGTDNAAQILANKGGTAFANPAAQARHPAFVAAPQCANAFSWELGDSKKVHSMIREIVAANPAIDADRIYALGCSMGGFMTWSAILGDPSVFAAAAPICAATSFFSPALSATDYAKARDLPMWLFQGGLDPTVDPAATRAAYEGLAAAGKVPGGAFKYTVFPTVAYNEHWSWVPVLNDCYDGATLGFMDWLFAQSRAGAGSAGREIAVAPGTGGAASNIAPAAPAAAAGGSAAGGKGGKGGESGESGEYGKGGKGGGSGAGGEPSKAPGRPGGAVGAGGSAASGSVSGSEIAGASHGYKIDVAGAAPQVGGDGTVTIPQGASADIAIGDGVVVRAPGGTAVSPEGRIRIPVGSGGATASLPDGSSVRIPQGYAVFEDAGAPLGFAYEYENPFIDVGAGDWFHGAVQRTVENGLFNGTSQNTFSPNGTMTRAMIVTVLHRMEGQPRGAGASGFADVPAGQWHSEAVAWGEANGIVLGFTETRFGGDEPVAREQIAAILHRYAGYKGRDVSGGADIGEFADAASVSGYALEAVRWAVGEGLIQGRGANDIAPQGNATRAEVAAIIQRYMER